MNNINFWWSFERYNVTCSLEVRGKPTHFVIASHPIVIRLLSPSTPFLNFREVASLVKILTVDKRLTDEMFVDLCFNSSTAVRHSGFGSEHYRAVITDILVNKT